MSRRAWKSAKFTDVQPRSSGNVLSFQNFQVAKSDGSVKRILVALFMTTHGPIQMDFFDVNKMHLKPVLQRGPTEAEFSFENELSDNSLSVEFKQARPQNRRRPLSEGQVMEDLVDKNQEGQTIEKCQLQTDCNNCFLMIKTRDQNFFSLNGVLKGNDIIISLQYT